MAVPSKVLVPRPNSSRITSEAAVELLSKDNHNHCQNHDDDDAENNDDDEKVREMERETNRLGLNQQSDLT
jgi:hypothetical protein